MYLVLEFTGGKMIHVKVRQGMQVQMGAFIRLQKVYR